MKTLGADPAIAAMANGLQLDPVDPVRQILEYCRKRIREWVKKHGFVCSILDLEHIVCDELNLTIRDVWSDEDLESLILEYAEERDPAFALLRDDLDETTYAALMERRAIRPSAEPAYVAVIDCRGEKGHRRFFSRWHEIAHLLTLYTQLDFPFHRSTIKKNATEQMMDLIAGEIGFLDDLFLPFLEDELRTVGRLTFAGIDRVRTGFCSDASHQATMNACVGRTRFPVVLLEIGLGFKQSESRQMAAGSGVRRGEDAPKPAIRVLAAMPNVSARQSGLQIHRNMRVPGDSIITKLFRGNDEPDYESQEAVESLGAWVTSDGGALPEMHVHVEAMRVKGKVIALVTPLNYGGARAVA